MTRGRVLIIAGSDSSGGAGIQADIKAVTCLQGFAMTAITALTAQNTTGVFGVQGTEPDFVAEQARLSASDIGVDAVKTGMLHSVAIIEVVAGLLGSDFADVPAVIDPVMVAQSGASLLQPDAVSALKSVLLPQAALLTPNLPEAGVLLGREISDTGQMRRAAEEIGALGPKAVLLKGGHGREETVTDVLWTRRSGAVVFSDRRLGAANTHGTGCTLASAIATGLAQGLTMSDAVSRARAYVRAAIRNAPGFGAGNGPLAHGHTVCDFPAGKG